MSKFYTNGLHIQYMINSKIKKITKSNEIP